MNTKRTLPPAHDYCNAIGPVCGQDPVALVVTSVKDQRTTNFSDLVCREHLNAYVALLIDPSDESVVAIRPLPMA